MGTIGEYQSDRFRVLELFSSLNLGDGNLLRGFGCEQLSDPFSWILPGAGESHDLPTIRVVNLSSNDSRVTLLFDTRRLKVPSIVSHRFLARLTSNIVNTRRVEAWDVDRIFIPVIVYLRDYDAFMSLFESLPRRQLRQSRVSITNQKILLEGDTVEWCDGFDCCISVFQVPKKGNEDRFIADATPVNEKQTKPPTPMIPRLHTVLENLVRRRWFFSIDAVNFFYQLVIEDIRIRGWFTCNLNRRSRRSIFLRLKRMPMGWKFSPGIGQRCALVIRQEILRRCKEAKLNVDIEVWIDNFLFGCDTQADAYKTREIATQVFKECNLKVHPSTPISTSFDAIGFTVSHGAIRHAPSFVEKFKNQLNNLSNTSSLRDIAAYCGNCVWTCFSKRIPLAFFADVIRTMRDVHRLINAGLPWDSVGNINVSQLQSSTATLVDTSMLPFTIASSTECPWIEVFSDAMSDEGGRTWAFVSGEDVHQGVFNEPHHIFLLELLAACAALVNAASVDPRAQVILWVDNTATLFALRAGHSGNAKADEIIRKLFSVLPVTFTFKVAHVCSEFNRADEYTRGSTGYRGPFTTIMWG